MHILRDLGCVPNDLAVSSAVHQTDPIAAGRRQVRQRALEDRERGVRPVYHAARLEARQQRLVELDRVPERL